MSNQRRKAFAVSPFWFWFMAGVCLVIVLSIPGVGGVLFVPALIFVILIWVKGRQKVRNTVSANSGSSSVSIANTAQVPAPMRVERLPILARQEVVGEYYYKDQIGEWVERNGRTGTALLILEPDNPHSPSGKAVRVDLAADNDHVTCGYMPEELAPIWFDSISVMFNAGAWAFCDVEIRGGWAKAPNYGVWIIPEGTAKVSNSTTKKTLTVAHKKATVKVQSEEGKKSPRFVVVEDGDGDPEALEFWSKQTPNTTDSHHPTKESGSSQYESTAATYPMTPVQLANELGHKEDKPGHKIRSFLRTRYPDREKGTKWLLTEEQANEVRNYFAQ